MNHIENEKIVPYKKKSQFGSVWKRLIKNRTALAGLIIFGLLVLTLIFADVIADYNTRVIAQDASQRLQEPSASHWFGTDQYGRDLFARVVHGTRASLTIGLATVALGMIIGIIVGAMAGYFGGWSDNVIMRILDVIMSIPPILLALALVAVMGAGIMNLMVALAIASFPNFARVTRSVVMPIAGQDFIEAAKACGTGNTRIIFRHVIPNAVGPIIVQGTMAVSKIIIAAAGLSYLGMGIQPPTPEWGSMLSSARDYMATSPHLVIIPGITIVIAALSINLLGDGLRDALDPRLKS